MTREEAIKYLEQHRHSNPCGRKVLEESNEAIDMAIKALTEPSREEVLKAIEYRRKTANIDSRIVLDEVADRIREFPSADRPTLEQTDTLIIADALRYLAQDTERHLSDRTRADALREQILEYGASICKPSADRPHGEFEICGNSNGLNGTMYYKCSLCGTPIDVWDKFCRGCGADMRGEK